MPGESGVECGDVGSARKVCQLLVVLLGDMGCPPLECSHRFYLDVEGGWVGFEYVQYVSHSWCGRGVCRCPKAADPVSGLLTLAVEGGSAGILLLQGLCHGVVLRELRVDGLSYVIPYAVISP